MDKFVKSFLTLFSVLPLIACQQNTTYSTDIDYKSYINDFEFLHENPINSTRVRIMSPKAIINPINNDFEIFQSSIQILNNNNKEFEVKSGNSILNNYENIIKVFNNVNISFHKDENYYITTKSFIWDLNSSDILLNNPLFINFKNSKIIADKGQYNIDSKLLKLNNTNLYRIFYNAAGEKKYEVEIKSDYSQWFKKNNTLVFTSNKNQVETTINLKY